MVNTQCSAGRYMVTSGLDKQMKVWDIRMYKPVSQYYTSRPATSLDISQRDMLGVGFGAHIQIWKDALRTKAKSPYMRHAIPGNVIASGGLRFRPFEDALMLGHSKGLSSIVVPGSGEPNFDSFAANPFETNKQRRETTVHRLLDKLAPEMIQLDPSNIGRVDRVSSEVLAEERKLAAEANAAASGRPPKKAKKKMRGRNKLGKRLKRKQYNIVTKDRMLRQEQLAERKREERDVAEGRQTGPSRAGWGGGGGSGGSDHGAALSIFGKKKKATRSRTSR
jgi:U3 small nucleolar RNA-associated protein 7